VGETIVPPPGLATVSMVVQRSFLGWIVLELIIRVAGQRANYLLGDNAAWNMFDLVVLIVSFVELASSGMKLSFIRAIRVVRSLRVLKAARSFRHSEQLQKMMMAAEATGASVFWAMCLMSILVYVVALAMVEAAAGLAKDGMGGAVDVNVKDYGYGTGFREMSDFTWVQDLENLYGGFGRAVMTLFRAISGADWSTFAAPLVAGGNGWAMVWFFYIIVAVFGGLNIITAVVVDIVRRPIPSHLAQQVAVEAAEEQRLATLLCNEVGVFGNEDDATISEHRFEAVMRRRHVAKALKDFGIAPERAMHSFGLIDFQGRVRLSPRTIAFRMLAMRGEARGHQLAQLSMEVKGITEELRRFKKERLVGQASLHTHSEGSENPFDDAFAI